MHNRLYAVIRHLDYGTEGVATFDHEVDAEAYCDDRGNPSDLEIISFARVMELAVSA